MPTRDDILREKTFKEEGIDLDSRIFYTLHGETPPGESPYSAGRAGERVHRTSRLVALLIARLREKDIIDDDEVDDMLLEIVK